MDVCIKVSRLCGQVRRNLGPASKLLLDLATKRSAVKRLAKHGSGMHTAAERFVQTDASKFCSSVDAFPARARAEPDG